MQLRTALSITLVFIVAVGLYWPSTDHPFQFDDGLFLRDDNVKQGNWQALVWPPTPRMLTWLTFLLQYQASGTDAGPYHAFNVLLHGICAALVFLFLSCFSAPPGGAPDRIDRAPLLGALIFAVHPLQTEAVLYIYQRSTLLATCFSLLCLLSYQRRRHWLSLVFLLLAVVSKEFTVVLPLIMWSMDGFLRKRWKPHRWLILYFVVTVSLGTCHLIWTQPWAEGGVRTWVYAATQVKVICYYLGLAIVPLPLNLDYDIPAQHSVIDLQWWLFLGVVVGLCWVALQRRRTSPELSFFVCLFFAFLLPTSTIVPSQDYMFEHRAYASMAAFAGLISTYWQGLLSSKGGARYRAAMLLAGVAMLLVFYSAMGRNRLQDWRDEESLWRDSVEKSPSKYRPNYNLGVILMERNPEESILYLARAVSIGPTIPLAYRSLGEVCFRLGNLNSAEQFWKRALEIDPADAPTHVALGQLYTQERNFFAAHGHLESAQTLDPIDWRSYLFLGELNLQFGFLQRAILQGEMGLNRAPGNSALLLLVADAVARTPHWHRALGIYRDLLNRDPANSDLYYRLAQAHWEGGEREKAIQLVRDGVARAAPGSQVTQGRALLERMLSEEPESIDPPND